jgi:hypothetical protein
MFEPGSEENLAFQDTWTQTFLGFFYENISRGFFMKTFLGVFYENISRVS